MKKILKILVNVLVWLVLIIALLVTIIVFSSGRNNGVANLLGYIPMTVESDSMKPTFSRDDLIVCKEVDDVYALKKDDVITFWTIDIVEGQRVKNTHRIVEVIEDGGSLSFVTKGDNNPAEDTSQVPSGDVIGKWTGFRIGGFGKVMNFLRTKTGFFICIVVPMAIFFLVELYKFIVTVIELRKPELSEEDEEEIKRRAIEEYLASQKAEAEKAEAEKAAAEAQDEAQEAQALVQAVDKAAEEVTAGAAEAQDKGDNE